MASGRRRDWMSAFVMAAAVLMAASIPGSFIVRAHGHRIAALLHQMMSIVTG